MGQNAENAGMAAEPITKFRDFQAEYEGSIPFTRSKLYIAAKDRCFVRSGRVCWRMRTGRRREPRGK